MKKSSVLIVAYFIVAIMVILAVALLYTLSTESALVRQRERSLQAFYLAEAGIDYGIREVKVNGITSMNYTQSLGPGSFSVNISEVSLDRVRVEATGMVESVTKTVQTYLRPDVFARYAYFTDSETFLQKVCSWYGCYWTSTDVWFTSTSYIDGPVYTNSHYNISGSPVFDGEVKSHDDYINYYHGGPPQDTPQFNEGIELGAPEMPMPTNASDLRTAASSADGLYLNGKTLVVLNSDGTISITNSSRGWYNHNEPIPPNGAVFVEGGDLYVRGSLDGMLSLGTDSNIIITNNISYVDDPRDDTPTTESDDMLALISEQNVIVSTDDDDGSSVYDETAPYDVRIDATIMALGNSFVVENWDTVSPKGTLNVYGGIIQKNRGPVGTFSGSTKISGYSKDYRYDTRLDHITPPYYPRTGDWAFLSWRKG